MRTLTAIFTLLTTSVLAFSQEQPEQEYASAESAKYAGAAHVMITEGLRRLEPMLESVSGYHDTMYVGFPNIGDINSPHFGDPPQSFLDSVSSEGIVFEPYSRKPANKWDNYLVITVLPHGTNDSVRFAMTEDCHGIKGRMLAKGEIFVTPTQAGAMATLVRKHGKWEIVDWNLMLME